MEELDLKELLTIFWNKKIHIILIVAIFMVIGIIYTLGFTNPMYSSWTTLVLAGTNQSTTDTITQTDININSKLVSTYSELVKSKKVLRQVKANLNMDLNETTLKNHIKVSSVKDTELIEITVTDENPSNACVIANEIANVFMDMVDDIYNIDNVQVVDEAEVSQNPSNINHQKDIAIFTFAGIVVAVIYVLVANMLDTTMKTAEDIEREFKLPVLASIPSYDIELQKSKARKKGGRR